MRAAALHMQEDKRDPNMPGLQHDRRLRASPNPVVSAGGGGASLRPGPRASRFAQPHAQPNESPHDCQDARDELVGGRLRTPCVQGAAQAGASPMAGAIGQQIRACARPCAWGLTGGKSDTVISLLRTLFKNAPTTIRANGIYDRMYLTWATGRTWSGAAPSPKASARPRPAAADPRQVRRGGHTIPAESCPVLRCRQRTGRCWALCVRCSAVLGVMLPGGESGKCAPKQSRALDCD